MKNKRRVSIITLGCKVNQYESNSIYKSLEENGFDVCPSLCEADCYVLNTCAVTNEAERKSRGVIAKIKKLNPSAPIFVCGCSAQNDPSKFARFENVKAVYGTSSKFELVNRIMDYYSGKSEQVVSSEISSVYQDNYMAKTDRTRAFVKIQEGCNNFCSYCLIPYLRGRERSRSLASIENELRLVKEKEVVFTGINLTSYGSDQTPKVSLADVAMLMRKYPQIRFRFSSLEQDIISPKFLDVLKATPNFCPHFHLSLQSGSDTTLKFMNRKYTSSQYFDKVQLIRKYFKNASITTDMIVGFPTETDTNFEESWAFAKKCAFAKIHIFPYSTRSKTAASRMKNIATNVKERVAKLTELDKQLQRAFIASQAGTNVNMLIETEENGFYIGHSENYIKCYLSSSLAQKLDSIVQVKIGKFFKDGAIVNL